MKNPLIGSGAALWRIHAAGVTFAAGIAAGSYLLFVGPSLGRGEEMTVKQAELAAQQEELITLSTANKDTQAALAAARLAAQSSGVTLQTRQQLNQRLADLTQLATRSHLEIEQLAAGKYAEGLRYGTISIHCTGKGMYRDCAAFVAACGVEYPDIAVIGLTATSNPEIPESPVFLMVDLLWFIASDKPGIAK
ncbi:MAG: hypothetical protein H7210_03705 [Pyrinomonadaceae bacterium]|nr:hypothetical protein [Phycisphaerales bacterium]